MINNYGLVFLNFKIAQLYFSNGLCKILSNSWRNGYSIKIILISFYGTFNKIIIPSILSEILTGITLFWELIGFWLLFFEETRLYAITLGIMFHIGMLVTMSPIWTFQTTSLFMLSTFIKYEDINYNLGLSLQSTLICEKYHDIVILFLYLFFIVQFIDVCIPYYTKLKSILYTYTKFLYYLNINEYGKYTMFHDYTHIVSYKAELNITYKDTNKNKIIGISDISQRAWAYEEIMKTDNDYKDLFTSTIIKRYKTDDVKCISYKGYIDSININKIFNIHNGGFVNNLNIIDKSESNYIIC